MACARGDGVAGLHRRPSRSRTAQHAVLMQPADFADRAFRTIQAGVSYRVIPWQMGVVAALRMLPNPCLTRCLAGRPRKRRQTEMQ